MRKILIMAFLLNWMFSYAQPGELVSRNQVNRVQIAILFDTSNSMDGLIDQARSRIWQIVNVMSNLRYNGIIPVIEIALFEYGNDNIMATEQHARMILPLTNDMDLISQKLFSLTTRGGQEFCGAVISKSLTNLNWSYNPFDVKMIYIAGNEPFNQGNVNYKDVCNLAAQRDIKVNTIYCGDYQQGVKEFWYDGAQIGKGEYSNINSNAQLVHYQTPYDEEINLYNDKLNRTYIHYGKEGSSKKANQEFQDQNALKQSASAKTERAIVKSKAAYNNASWDLIDAVAEEKVDVKTLKDEELPEEMKGKSDKEKEEIVLVKKVEREQYQKKIAELSLKRAAHIEEEKKKSVSANESDFGEEVKKNIEKMAKEKGYSIQK
jgi:hypothetical protein